MAIKVFHNIGELMTLEGAVEKQGRGTQEDDLGLIKKAAVVVDGQKILWVGTEKNLPKAYKKKAHQDCKGLNVYPGFIDCHTHMIFAGDRKSEFEMRNRGVSYQEIASQGGGILNTVEATRRASLSTLIELGQQRALRHLRQGVTTVEIKSGYGLNQKTEEKMLKAALSLKGPDIVTTYLGAHAVPKSHANSRAYIQELLNGLERIHKKDLAKRVDIFIEQGFFSLEDARLYLDKAKSLGFEMSLHTEQMSHLGGTQLALEYGARSADHLVHINWADIEKIAKAKDFTAVLLPNPDLYLECDYPPARKLIDSGARVALATDFNPGNSPSQNMGLLGLLARLKMKMTLPEVFVAMTYAGAHVLGLEKDKGALLPGFDADFYLTDWSWQEHFYDLHNLEVDRVYVRGRKQSLKK